MKTETTKPQSPKMDKLIQIRISEPQHELLRKRANQNNLNVSDYVRKVATGKTK